METRYADGQGAVWEGEGLPRRMTAGRLLMAGSLCPRRITDQSVERLSAMGSLLAVW